MMRLQGDYRKGLQDLVDKKGMKAVLMGTRAGDPDGGQHLWIHVITTMVSVLRGNT